MRGEFRSYQKSSIETFKEFQFLEKCLRERFKKFLSFKEVLERDCKFYSKMSKEISSSGEIHIERDCKFYSKISWRFQVNLEKCLREVAVSKQRFQKIEVQEQPHCKVKRLRFKGGGDF